MFILYTSYTSIVLTTTTTNNNNSNKGSWIHVSIFTHIWSDIRSEMMPALSELQDRSEVTNFNKESKLKHVETTEKNLLPTKEGT